VVLPAAQQSEKGSVATTQQAAELSHLANLATKLVALRDGERRTAAAPIHEQAREFLSQASISIVVRLRNALGCRIRGQT